MRRVSRATLYVIPGSHPAMAAQRMLEHKGIDYKRRDLLPVVSRGVLKLMRFPGVTIPSLRNTITIVILLTLVDAFKVFDIIWATTQGGPIRATEVLSTYLFKEGFQQNQYGYGSAIAVALAIIILVSSILNLTIRERGDE